VGYQSSGDIINDVETSILHQVQASELQDSNYESDPDPRRHGPEAFTAHEFDTEIPDNSTSSLPSRLGHYPRAGEAIADVDGFEQDNSYSREDIWESFSCVRGFNMACCFLQSKVHKS